MDGVEGEEPASRPLGSRRASLRATRLPARQLCAAGVARKPRPGRTASGAGCASEVNDPRWDSSPSPIADALPARGPYVRAITSSHGARSGVVQYVRRWQQLREPTRPFAGASRRAVSRRTHDGARSSWRAGGLPGVCWGRRGAGCRRAIRRIARSHAKHPRPAGPLGQRGQWGARRALARPGMNARPGWRRFSPREGPGSSPEVPGRRFSRPTGR